MQGYVPGPDGAFAQSRECYAELEEWLASEDAAGLQHGELEEQLDVRGRELLRRLYQDRLDLMAAREVRRHDVTGEDGIPRTRAEKAGPGHWSRSSGRSRCRGSRTGCRAGRTCTRWTRS